MAGIVFAQQQSKLFPLTKYFGLKTEFFMQGPATASDICCKIWVTVQKSYL